MEKQKAAEYYRKNADLIKLEARDKYKTCQRRKRIKKKISKRNISHKY